MGTTPTTPPPTGAEAKERPPTIVQVFMYLAYTDKTHIFRATKQALSELWSASNLHHLLVGLAEVQEHHGQRIPHLLDHYTGRYLVKYRFPEISAVSES
jgi:hypothetical protein